MASEEKTKQNCLFKGCVNQGIPRDGQDFFVCDVCLDELEQSLEREWQKRLQRHLNN
ncbi:MAG: hypothetical protein ACP5EP_12470 [Acidobacteriaceae bacterium]